MLELDERGQIISYEEYYPYGSTSYQAVRSQTETPKRYRYTGMERDEESRLNYHEARYYAVWLGRWVSCDPIGLKSDPNLYVYCTANPITRTDKQGLDDSEWCILCNPFRDDLEPAPLEFSARITVGAAKTLISTGVDTGTRAIDLATQGTAATVKALTSTFTFDPQRGIIINEGIQLPYTTLSPEAKRYDEDLTYGENLHKTGSEIKEGFKSLAEKLANADPDAIGTVATFAAMSAAGGEPSGPPTFPSFPLPRLATSVTTTGTRAFEFVWESTVFNTSTLAKFGGPILAVGVTNTPSSDIPSSDSPSGKPKLQTQSPKQQQRIEIEQALKNYKKPITRMPESPHLHHLLPREFKEFFERLQIDIEKFKVWLDPKTHLKDVHGGAGGGGLWNQTWADFIRTTVNPTVSQVMGQLKKMRKSFGI